MSRIALFRSAFAAFAVALTLAIAPTFAQAQDVKVIVHTDNAVEAMTAAEVTKLFLKQVTKFPGGSAATPVDQKGAVRTAFAKVILGRPAAAVDTYWQQQVFSGKDVPPTSKSSDDEVIAFVKANPGAIGYVSAGAAPAGVKVVAIK